MKLSLSGKFSLSAGSRAVCIPLGKHSAGPSLRHGTALQAKALPSPHPSRQRCPLLRQPPAIARAGVGISIIETKQLRSPAHCRASKLPFGHALSPERVIQLACRNFRVAKRQTHSQKVDSLEIQRCGTEQVQQAVLLEQRQLQGGSWPGKTGALPVECRPMQGRNTLQGAPPRL